MPRGGYRKPANPAPVSGPSSLSKRTDGGPADKKQPARYVPGQAYGEGQALMNVQNAAPMAAVQTPANLSLSNMAGGSAQQAPIQVTPLGAPTARPDEPITAGVDIGAGPGSAALGLAGNLPSQNQLAAALEPLLSFDKTGDIRFLYDIAVKRGW